MTEKPVIPVGERVSRIRFEVRCEFLSQDLFGKWTVEKEFLNHLNLNPLLLEEDYGEEVFLKYWESLGISFLKKIK